MTDPELPDAVEALADQLRDEVGAVVASLLSLFGPAAAEEVTRLDDLVHTRARTWALELLGDDDRIAADTVIGLAPVLWPGQCEPVIDWASPLGRAIARSVGHPTAQEVTYSVAGAMLGVTKQRVGQWVKDGRLRVGEHGGVASDTIGLLLRARADEARRPVEA